MRVGELEPFCGIQVMDSVDVQGEMDVGDISGRKELLEEPIDVIL